MVCSAGSLPQLRAVRDEIEDKFRENHGLRPMAGDRNLESGWLIQHYGDVMAVDRDGKMSEPAATKLVQTAPPWRVPPWVWRTLIAITLGAVAAGLYRARNGSWGFSARLSAARG